MRFTLSLAMLLIAGIAFTGCATTGTTPAVLPTLTPAQITQIADDGNAVVDQLVAAKQISPAKGTQIKAQIAQFQADALLASNLVALVNQLRGVQTGALVVATPTPVAAAP